MKKKFTKSQIAKLEKQIEQNEKQDEWIDFALQREKKPYQSLGIGIHDGHFYFGTVIEDDHFKHNAVVLDDGTIYVAKKFRTDLGGVAINDEIKKTFGLNYRFDLFDDVIDHAWSNSSILNFRKKKVDMKFINFRFLFECIRKLNQKYMWYPDERVHDFVACDLISNYFYPLFNAKGRTYFQAEFGSGKSRQSLIYQLLSFNPLFASHISPASFERVIESTGGTIIVDNFDNINEDLKKAILQVIEVYYKKGGKNIKADGNKEKNRPTAFSGYSPLVINNIIGLPQVTESRCNKFQLLRCDDKSITDARLDEKDPTWRSIRDSLHILALTSWKQVDNQYKSLIVPDLGARDLERAEAVLTIAKCCGEDVYQRVLKIICDTNEQSSIRELRDSWEFLVYQTLHNILSQESTKEKEVLVADITSKCDLPSTGNELLDKREKLKFSHYAGKVLGAVPTFKKGVSGGYVRYKVTRSDLDKMLKIKGFSAYLEKDPTKPTKPTNTTNPTNTTEKNGVLVESVGSKYTGGPKVSDYGEV